MAITSGVAVGYLTVRAKHSLGSTLANAFTGAEIGAGAGGGPELDPPEDPLDEAQVVKQRQHVPLVVQLLLAGAAVVEFVLLHEGIGEHKVTSVHEAEVTAPAVVILELIVVCILTVPIRDINIIRTKGSSILELISKI